MPFVKCTQLSPILAHYAQLLQQINPRDILTNILSINQIFMSAGNNDQCQYGLYIANIFNFSISFGVQAKIVQKVLHHLYIIFIQKTTLYINRPITCTLFYEALPSSSNKNQTIKRSNRKRYEFTFIFVWQYNPCQ